jgi:hypothetical protein
MTFFPPLGFDEKPRRKRGMAEPRPTAFLAAKFAPFPFLHKLANGPSRYYEEGGHFEGFLKNLERIRNWGWRMRQWKRVQHYNALNRPEPEIFYVCSLWIAELIWLNV